MDCRICEVGLIEKNKYRGNGKLKSPQTYPKSENETIRNT